MEAISMRAFDGPIDPAIEQEAERVVRGAHEQRARAERSEADEVGSEAAAHALLRIVGDFPGQMGRVRAARLIGGYRVQHHDSAESEQLGRYAVNLSWPLREIVRLVDAMLDGGLVTKTAGPRPVLVLTRAGFQALQALESPPR